MELAPDLALLFNRAVALQALKNWAAAEADFTRVLEAEPTEAEAWLRRAACRTAPRQRRRRHDDQRQAAVIAPDHLAAEVMVAGSAP